MDSDHVFIHALDKMAVACPCRVLRRDPCEEHTPPFHFSSCLSRACIGKPIIMFVLIERRHGAFSGRIQSGLRREHSPPKVPGGMVREEVVQTASIAHGCCSNEKRNAKPRKFTFTVFLLLCFVPNLSWQMVCCVPLMTAH
jgi:hypothetical protein